MRSTALSLGFAIAALALGCELDTNPGQGVDAIEDRDGAASAGDDGGAGARGDAGRDGGRAGRDGGGGSDGGAESDSGTADGGQKNPCGSCTAKTPVCLAATGRCVQCARDRDCDDPARPVCDLERHACVQCNEDSDCSGDTPRCAAETRTCVQCADDGDCSDGDAPRCELASGQCVACLGDNDCSGGTPICVLDAHACVQCATSADCPASAPQCDANACGACTSGDACADRAETSVCDLAADSPVAGTCVQCVVADESPCQGRVCDPQSRTCSDRSIASKHTCEPCIADSECVADHRCITMQFGGAVRAAAYCMKQLSSGCAPPFMSAPLRRASRSGAAAEDYCGIDEQTTTCEAIAGLLTSVQCPGATDAECGREGSVCRTVNGGANYCSYACVASAQCPSAFPCGSGYCGGPSAGDD